jgi:hypothetical protein
MPKLVPSQSDILATTQLEGGWYVLEVKSMSDWVPGTKDPNSNNLIADFIVVGPKKIGVPIRHYFSEKTIGTANDMLFGSYLPSFTADGKLEPGKEYRTEDTVGKKVEAFCAWDNGPFKGNKISEFRKYKGTAAAA